MQQESRVKKSLLNARVNLLFYLLTLALSFFSRRIFLDTLGADFIGLTGTLYNLLNFLNLAELGIGSAIGYVLYKPLFEHDQQRINEIISVMGYLYRCIGLFILVAGSILACFIPLIFPSSGFELRLIYFAFFSFLASSLIGYFVNYRQNLLGADQKNYIVTAYFHAWNLLKVIIQIALALYTGNYYLWVAIELSFGILYSFILNWKIQKTYPWLKSEASKGRSLFRKYPDVFKYTRQLFVHKIAAFFQYQSTPFIIYLFISLKMVAYYGNYSIVCERLAAIVRNLLDSTYAGVGNLIAEGNTERIKNTFWKLLTARFLTAAICAYCLFTLLPPLICLWLGSEYVLPRSILFLVVCNVFLDLLRGTTDQFIYGYGLFYDVWAPLTEAAIFLVTAIIGGYLWGLQGILLGSIVSKVIIVYIWKSYFLFSKGFHLSTLQFWPKWFFFLLLFMAACLFARFLSGFTSLESASSTSWWYLTIYAFFSFFAFSAVYYALLLSFSKDMRAFTSDLVGYATNSLRKQS